MKSTTMTLLGAFACLGLVAIWLILPPHPISAVLPLIAFLLAILLLKRKPAGGLVIAVIFTIAFGFTCIEYRDYPGSGAVYFLCAYSGLYAVRDIGAQMARQRRAPALLQSLADGAARVRDEALETSPRAGDVGPEALPERAPLSRRCRFVVVVPLAGEREDTEDQAAKGRTSETADDDR